MNDHERPKMGTYGFERLINRLKRNHLQLDESLFIIHIGSGENILFLSSNIQILSPIYSKNKLYITEMFKYLKTINA